jgi:hypothetical protein
MMVASPRSSRSILRLVWLLLLTATSIGFFIQTATPVAADNSLAPTLSPSNCRLTRTPAPAFVYDPAINPSASLYQGTIAINTERGIGGTPLHIINLSNQDGVLVSGQSHPVVGQPWEDPAPERFNPTNSPYNWGNIGSVLGLTLDSWGNIYMAATSSFASTANPGRVYKVDSLTGRVSTFISNLPGDSSGGTSNASLGNLSSNIYLNNDIFVVSMDTGLIYRYGIDGVLKSTYDHGTVGRTTAGMETIPNIGSFGNSSVTIKGRRVWAVEVYDAGAGPRLYYSVIWRYNGQAPQPSDYTNSPYNGLGININDEDTNNQVWSVALNTTTGDFVPATARREFTTTYPGIWQGTATENQNAQKWPVSDIAFVGSSGTMILATRGAQDNGSNDIISHEGQVFAATPSGVNWQLNATTFDGFGQIGDRNDGNGGVAWDPTALNGGGRVWITADALWEAIYNGPGPLAQNTYNIFGLIGMPDEGAPANQARQNGLLVDINSSNNQEKQTGGDVEIGCLPAFDYGDLPSLMSNTLLTNNGARHLIHLNSNGTPAAGQIYLGGVVDAETDGQPSGLANGDDTNGGDDEDGITANIATWSQAGGGSVNATVGGGSGWLVGWVDWNDDGVFSDSEMAFSQTVATGSQTINFSVPISTFPAGGLRTRFRLFTSQTAAQQVGIAMGGTTEASADIGPAANGEVEDYLFVVSASVQLEAFSAVCATAPAEAILVQWETASENNTLGFNLYRQPANGGDVVRLNPELIPAQAPGGGGATYEWWDETITHDTFTYWLEDVSTEGQVTQHEGVEITYPCVPTAVSLGTLAVQDSTPSLQTWVLAGAFLLAGGFLIRFRRHHC